VDCASLTLVQSCAADVHCGRRSTPAIPGLCCPQPRCFPVLRQGVEDGRKHIQRCINAVAPISNTPKVDGEAATPPTSSSLVRDVGVYQGVT